MKFEDMIAAGFVVLILILVYSLAAMTDERGLELACEEYYVERSE